MSLVSGATFILIEQYTKKPLKSNSLIQVYLGD